MLCAKASRLILWLILLFPSLSDSTLFAPTKLTGPSLPCTKLDSKWEARRRGQGAICEHGDSAKAHGGRSRQAWPQAWTGWGHREANVAVRGQFIKKVVAAGGRNRRGRKRIQEGNMNK